MYNRHGACITTATITIVMAMTESYYHDQGVFSSANPLNVFIEHSVLLNP